MPRDAHCVHSETFFAVAGSTLAFLGGQCKAAFAETFKFISQILFSQTHWLRFVSNLPWLTEATLNCAAPRLQNFLLQNFIVQESVTKIRNGQPLFVSVFMFMKSLSKLATLKAAAKKAN